MLRPRQAGRTAGPSAVSRKRVPARASIMSAMRIGILLGLLTWTSLSSASSPAPEAAETAAGKPRYSINQLIARFGGPASYAETRLTSDFDTSRIHDSIVGSLDRPRWYASETHSFLKNVLPGVSFAVVTYGSWRAGSFMQCAITGDGRIYQNEDLNSLLLAEGFSFDSSEFQTIAKIAVLMQYIAAPPPRIDSPIRPMLDRPPSPIAVGATAFPKVDFTSFAREVKKQPNGALDTRLTVICTIDGTGETATVDFHGTTYGRNSLALFKSPHRYLPYQPDRRPEPYTTPQGCQSVPNSGASAKAAHPDLVALGQPAEYAATYFRETTVDSMTIAPYLGFGGVERRRLVTRGWVSDSQQFLSRILPGAKFLRVLVGLEQHTEYWVRLADGQSFRVAPNGQMREMLAAQSIRFDSTNVDAAAKIAVLFAYCGRRIKTSPDTSPGYKGAEGQGRGEPDTLAFPSVEFRSFERGVWVSPGKSQFDGVWADCVIEGIARRVFVMMSGSWSSDLRPSGVQSPDVSTGFV